MLDPDSPYVAYCPPGALDDSRETLDRGGHAYRELEENPILEGKEEIILIDTSVQIEVPPLVHFWWEAAFMKHHLSGPLIVSPPSSPYTGSTS